MPENKRKPIIESIREYVRTYPGIDNRKINIDYLEQSKHTVTLMRPQNHSGVVLLLQLFTLLMAQIIINQHFTDHQLQQTSHLVFLEES